MKDYIFSLVFLMGCCSVVIFYVLAVLHFEWKLRSALKCEIISCICNLVQDRCDIRESLMML